MMDETRIQYGGEVRSRIFTFGRVAEAVEAISRTCGGVPVFVLYDVNAKKYAVELEAALKEAEAPKFEGAMGIEATEEKKSMETVLEICRWLLEKGADRDALLVAIGGGITSDIGGFAACIYKRGINFGYIPTTLLAQVDAGIGGKTGVNFEDYKNILGVIRQPVFTCLCTEVLESLPYRDFKSGASEMLKTFLIDDSEGMYEKAVTILSAIEASKDRNEAIKENAKALKELVKGAAGIKAAIVSRDPYEHGERRKLNLGHTFAHAIEHNARECAMDISHGEAVAMGIVLAARLSDRVGLSDGSMEKRIREDFGRCGLMTECPFGIDELSGAMGKDKKAEGGIIHFVLIRSIGNVEIKDLGVAEATEMMRKPWK
jgi:3-dehydroquinate synthetase